MKERATGSRMDEADAGAKGHGIILLFESSEYAATAARQSTSAPPGLLRRRPKSSSAAIGKMSVQRSMRLLTAALHSN